MSIGFACKTVGVEGTALKSLTQKNATPEKLRQTIAENLKGLDGIFTYAANNNLHLFRISSDVIPFAGSPVNPLDWQAEFAEQLHLLGNKACGSGIRLSMHPGQYTVLNSPREEVVRRAVSDLEYHCAFLDGMGLASSHKIVLHIGGVYDDRKAATDRFVESYHRLAEPVKRRLVLENDDRCYTIEELLAISRRTGAPVVFDNLHHRLNPPATALPDSAWIQECGKTWRKDSGRQKIHYSQQAASGKPGAHSATIALAEFLPYYQQIQGSELDIMLEVKDKNRSAVKCVLATAPRPKIAGLEREWGRYKYLVMEKDLNAYRQIRRLLNDKTRYPVLEMFTQLEAALDKPTLRGNAINAASHVWGYFKNNATPQQAGRFRRALLRYSDGEIRLDSLKTLLYRLAVEYQQEYLLSSYYFAF